MIVSVGWSRPRTYGGRAIDTASQFYFRYIRRKQSSPNKQLDFMVYVTPPEGRNQRYVNLTARSGFSFPDGRTPSQGLHRFTHAYQPTYKISTCITSIKTGCSVEVCCMTESRARENAQSPRLLYSSPPSSWLSSSSSMYPSIVRGVPLCDGERSTI